jgi:hypothetical protein
MLWYAEKGSILPVGLADLIIERGRGAKNSLGYENWRWLGR